MLKSILKRPKKATLAAKPWDAPVAPPVSKPVIADPVVVAPPPAPVKLEAHYDWFRFKPGAVPADRSSL